MEKGKRTESGGGGMARANRTWGGGGPATPEKSRQHKTTLPRSVVLRVHSPGAPVFQIMIGLRLGLTIAGLLTSVPRNVTSNLVFDYGRIFLPPNVLGLAAVPTYFHDDEELNRSLNAVELHSALVESVSLYLSAPDGGWKGKSLEHRAADVARAGSLSKDRRRPEG